MNASSMPVRASLSLAVALALGAAANPAQAAACAPVIDGGKTVNLPDLTPSANGYAPSEQALGVKSGGNAEYGRNPQYLWTLSGPGRIENASQKDARFIAPDVGPSGTSVTVTLTVKSDTCTAGSDSITINVRDTILANQPPTAVATATPAQALEGQRVTLDAGASWDPDGNPLTYVWTQTGGPGVTIDNATGKVASFVVPQVSGDVTLGFKVEVSDGALKASAPALVSVSWTNRRPNAAASCPASVDERGTVVLDGSASDDSDDGIVAYRWEQTTSLPQATLPDGASWDAAVVTFQAPTLGYDQVGDMPFRLTVTDRGGLQDTADCMVMVDDVTSPVLAVSDLVEEATSPLGDEVLYVIEALDNVDGPMPATCTPPAGTLFALDAVTPVNCSATDSAGNVGVARFTVSVVDTTAPTLDLPLSHAVEATGPRTVVNFDATSNDIVDGVQPAVCTPAAGSLFALGTTEVGCAATDAHGNVAPRKTFTVNVVDTTGPEFSGVSGDVVLEATSPAGALLTYALPTATDLVDGEVAVSCLPPPGTTVALGTSAVACEATDLSGNVAEAGFGVTVRDTIAPVIEPHGNETAEATGPDGAIVAYALPAVSDAVSVSLVASCSPAPGSMFALGTTTVTCTATDGAGNVAEPVSFEVKVEDTTAPLVINANPASRTVEATSAAGAVVEYAALSAIDVVDGDVPVVCSHASGATFPLGTTTVTCGATDAAGNASALVSFDIVVRDTTAPTLAGLVDVTALATGRSAAIVNYASPTAVDLVDGSVAVSCTPASGSLFNVGATTVTCAATDSRGNTASGTFTVTVRYAFTGFLQPVDNLPATNVVKAGSAVPVKFSLGGDQGLDILQAGYPKSGPIGCDATAGSELEQTVTAGSSSLQYDATTGQYIYVWKTDRSWTGCRMLNVTLRDGTTKSALFRFR